MKKMFSFFFLVFLSGSVTLNGQDFATKGAIELGGSIGFSSTKQVFDGETVGNSLNIFIFQPYFGYFVIDNLEIALIPSITNVSSGGNFLY